MTNRWILLLLIACAGCVKDKPNADKNTLPSALHAGVLICNEGSYGNQNAEISFLDQQTNTTFQQLYFTANGKKLGDIAQHISLINQTYIIPLNHSDKLVRLHPQTFEEIAVISPVRSPRYIVQVSATKAYVSCLYEPTIYVVDLALNQVSKIIQTSYPNTEQMLLLYPYCYVTNWDTSSNVIYKVNVQTDSIEETISLPGKASHDILADKDGMLWILSGNPYKKTAASLTCYNPNTRTTKAHYTFPLPQDPIRLQCNSTKDTLYFLSVDFNGGQQGNGLYRMGIYENQLPAQPLIQANPNSYYWGYGIDPKTGHFFLSDPKGFTQQSSIYEYSNDAKLIQTFKAGVGANSFLFKSS
jgi:hypothetical protein